MKIISLIIHWIFRIFVLGLILVLLIGALGVYIIKTMFTPEHISDIVSTQLQEMFNRPVIISSLRVVIFQGIKIEKLQVPDDPKIGGDLISAGPVTLSYAWLALLKGKLVITEIEVDSPKINLVKFSDGTWNFSDIKLPQKNLKPTESSGLVLLFNTKHCAVNGGTLTIKDLKENKYYEFRNVDANIWNFSPDGKFTFRTSFLSKYKPGNSELDLKFYGEGSAGLAGFNWGKAFLENVSLQFDIAQKPVHAKVSAASFVNPLITAEVDLPQFNKEEISFLSAAPEGFYLPRSHWSVDALFLQEGIDFKKIHARF
ncbi:MAG: AsmA family protein, partial [Elusimicrobia bacterium]|nr:AsmA family protein [Elusimicrobiota bacterium]